jgi:hypothetical protein
MNAVPRCVMDKILHLAGVDDTRGIEAPAVEDGSEIDSEDNGSVIDEYADSADDDDSESSDQSVGSDTGTDGSDTIIVDDDERGNANVDYDF